MNTPRCARCGREKVWRRYGPRADDIELVCPDSTPRTEEPVNCAGCGYPLGDMGWCDNCDDDEV